MNRLLPDRYLSFSDFSYTIKINLCVQEVFMEWYLGVLKKYAVFSGRARRKEYWMFALFSIIISLIFWVIQLVLKFVPPLAVLFSVLSFIYSLAILVPSLAVGVRRLHDTGRSGFWLFLVLVPIVGWIVVLVFMALDGVAGENQYGSNPKEVAATAG
jgi:uncharacterized membrane protein YhaH (DUF805 family)